MISAAGLGWSWCFYFSALLTLPWAVAWWALGAATPEDLSACLPAERALILGCSELQLPETERRARVLVTPALVPWRKILSTPSIYGQFVADFSLNWRYTSRVFDSLSNPRCSPRSHRGCSFYVMLTFLPTYLHQVLSYDIQNSGAVTAMVDASQIVVYFLVGSLGDYLLATNKIGLRRLRQAATAVCGFGAGTALLLVTTTRDPFEIVSLMIPQFLK